MASYSKTQVNRAGRFFADLIQRVADDPNHLDDLALVKRAREAITIVEWWRTEHAQPLSRVAANLRYYAREVGDPIVAQRLKRVPTIAGKLLREPGMKLARMEDIGGVRAILPDQAAAYRVASRLRKNWTITRYRDYVAEPKSDGYRALHLTNRNHGRLIEVQLRTPLQDRWANAVEMVSRVMPGLKFGQGPPEIQELFRAVGEAMAFLDKGAELPISLEEQVSEQFGRVDRLLTEHENESG